MTENKELKQNFVSSKINEIVSRTVVNACFLTFELKTTENNRQLLHHSLWM